MKKKQEKFHLVVFGHRVRRLRQAQGLTQEQLAERMDCSLTYISKLENGRASCSMDRLFELADVNEEIAREALRLASHKLPVKCKFVKREEKEAAE